MADAAMIGWDIGGAHLKAVAVDAAGRPLAALQRPCALWRGLDHLERALGEALAQLATPGAAGSLRHAATMTGELVDLFPDRRDGVRRIVGLLRARLGGGLLLYAGGHGFVGPGGADRHAADLASANWCATASLVASRVGQALLADIGSTTTDLVAVRGGRPAPQGRSDFERLASGELVYCGVVRTPLMALADAVTFDDRNVAIMAEHFATTADVYRLTGELDERCDQHAAADGGDKTCEASARRLARMIGLDAIERPLSQWQSLAASFRTAQLARIAQAARGVLGAAQLAADAPLVAAGCGDFLVTELARSLGRPVIGFGGLLDAGIEDRWLLAVCAPAAAVAILALESLP